jgi:hypothetical protein
LADQFKTYADLLHQKYNILKESLSKLCDILCETEYQIGLLLDKYDNRDAKNHIGYMRHLRHLYVDLHEGILNNFKYELSGQTNQYLFWLLADVRKIIPEKDFILLRKSRLQAIKSFISKPRYSPLGSLSTGSFAEAFLELSTAINHEKYLVLYHEFAEICTPLIDFLDNIKDDFIQSLKELESGLNKSTLEEFEFREYVYLYGRYRGFMRTIQFVVDSIPRFKHLEELPDEIIIRDPYFVINYIVCAGGHMRIMNEVCGRSILNFREY